MRKVSAPSSVAAVLAALEGMLSGEDFPPGARLPTERELSETFHTSRSVVRRALDTLEADNRIIRHVGRGTFVAGEKHWDDATLIQLSTDDLFRARLALEPGVVGLAISSATPDDLAEMERCLVGGDKSSCYEDFEAWDIALHRSFALATHNASLIAFIDSLNRSRGAQAILLEMHRRSFPRALRDVYQIQHREIVDAVRQGDAANAERLMRMHLQYIWDNVTAKGDGARRPSAES